MTHIYFAAPLFSESEILYNQQLGNKIRKSYPEVTLFMPQESDDINDKNAYADSKMIAKLDTEAILKSDLVIAVMDGLVIDPGVASEIGVAYQADIPIIGIYSDSRQQGGTHPEKLAALQELAESQFSYINLYTVGLVKLKGEVVNSGQAAIDAIARYI